LTLKIAIINAELSIINQVQNTAQTIGLMLLTLAFRVFIDN